MKIFFIILSTYVLTAHNTTIACQCDELDSVEVNNLFLESRFVFEGHYFMTVSENKEQEKIHSHEGIGREVRFIITKKYKGITLADTIIIGQFSSGCSRFFRKGKNYLIFGNQVKFSELMDKKIPPLPPVRVDSQIFVELEKKSFEYWNNKIRENQIIFTDACQSWEVDSQKGQFVKRLLK